MSRLSATEAICEFISGTTFENLDAGTVCHARDAIVDGLANMLAGCRQPSAGPSREVFLAQGGSQEATVAGSVRRLPAPNAAFLNGVQLHSLDFEVQGFPPAHGTSSILPAGLAVAERDSLSGADVITAYVVGWEVQQRLRQAGAGADLRSFHPPGVFGPLGAAAAVASLTGLDPTQTGMALGYAASHAGGLFGNNGTGTKATHPGRAARVGVEASLLVRAGLSANPQILEDPKGYLAAFFASEYDGTALCKEAGEPLHIDDPGYLIKPFPAEVFMQWTIQALVELKAEEGLLPEDIVAVRIEPAYYDAHLLRPNPATGLDGKFSYAYCAAVALVEERVAIDSFSDKVRFSPEVDGLLKKIEVVENPEIPSDLHRAWSTVTVQTSDGRRLSHTCHKFPGLPERRINDVERLAKVSDCLRHGGLDHGSCASAVAALERLEDVDDVGSLMQTYFAHDPNEREDGMV